MGLRFSSEVLLIPLTGHTLGHCGVAIQQGGKSLLHVGDAYYLREELAMDDHPVSQIAIQRADNDAQRRATLDQLRRLMRDHGGDVEMIGYHDLRELPDHYPLP
jgi:glyoxylase-like metal-dependent hydrolase (beta-lactamase superfamily II)